MRKVMEDSPDFVERFLKKIRSTKSNDEFYQQTIDEMKRKKMTR